MAAKRTADSVQLRQAIAAFSPGRCECETAVAGNVTHRADGRVCQQARRWVAAYCRQLLAGDWLSWQHAVEEDLVDKEAKEHLANAILTRDVFCDTLLGMVQATDYLNRTEFITSYRNVLMEIGVLDE